MTETPTYIVRPATEADSPQINDIVNYEVMHSVSNFNYGQRSLEDGLTWFRTTIAGGYPILVATTVVDGRDSAEYSLYIHHEHRKRGLGRILLKDLLAEAKARNFHAIVGSISGGNEGSFRLAKEFGFRVVGTMKENGFKFDQWIDNTFVELLL
ncbi:hypothetical protein KI688_000918 [Linnemannia hyalina]|uniref:N-acetyltransferase domain-containing protein n=1 Tax=Linnemannia hyalina TaxID=64524 RepID=A0A9P7Y5G1_9FUNG|nr:hypothetical protein KI688_000918 [Linnemannia hyalina]